MPLLFLPVKKFIWIKYLCLRSISNQTKVRLNGTVIIMYFVVYLDQQLSVASQTIGCYLLFLSFCMFPQEINAKMRQKWPFYCLIHKCSGQSNKAHFGINYIKNGFNKLNFTLNYINFDVIFAQKVLFDDSWLSQMQ